MMRVLLSCRTLQAWFALALLGIMIWVLLAPKIFATLDHIHERDAMRQIHSQLEQRVSPESYYLKNARQPEFKLPDADFTRDTQRLILDRVAKAGGNLSEIRMLDEGVAKDLPPSLTLAFSFDGDIQSVAEFLESMAHPSALFIIEELKIVPSSLSGSRDAHLRVDMVLAAYWLAEDQ